MIETMEARPPAATLSIERAYHDDWCVNVLLSDGRIYSFITEMWPEHGDPGPTGEDVRWAPVMRRAKYEALLLADRGARTWALDALPETDAQFHKAMDFLCMRTSDVDFHYFMRH
jgi:hypothetical protein